MISLGTLADGETGIVAGYDDELPAPRRRRFEDLGLLPGTPVRRVQAAPLRDPLVFETRGVRLCLRASDAKLILLRSKA